MKLTFEPLLPDRWQDLVDLFGPRGACGGCWCMWWRLEKAEFEAKKGEGNKRKFKALVDSRKVPGLLAYCGATPVGWCAIAPREDYSRLQRSRSLKSIDDAPVWSVTCFFIRRGYRRKGVSVGLLKAAKKYVVSRGGKMLEGYPVKPKATMPDTFAYYGTASAFRSAGFTEVATPSAGRAIMRCAL